MFHLFKVEYRDWPSAAEGKEVASGKRKRGSTDPAVESCGRRGRGSKKARQAGSVAPTRVRG